MSELSALKQAHYHLKQLESHIKDNKWLGYVGIFVIIIVALQLIIGGLVNLEILTIKEQYEFLFSV